MDYVHDALDEISLEGLDGLTVRSLWTRLTHRIRPRSFPIALDDDGKNFVWSRLTRLEDLAFFLLPDPRPPVVVYSRYDNMDPDTGVVVEKPPLPDLYPISILGNGVRGSSSTYHTRRDVTERVRDGISLEQVEAEMGFDQLVIVASDNRRWEALFGAEADPQLSERLSDIQYCIMERIGRSRFHGEVTQGETSLAVFGESVKTMYYHRQYLLKLNLITKQLHTQKGLNNQLYQGSLLMLKRFHLDRQSKYSNLLERLCEILHRRPSQQGTLESLRREMELDDKTFKKLYHYGSQNVRVVQLPYREAHPDCTDAEAHTKAGKEKTVRFMRLIKMYVYNAHDAGDEEDDEEEGVNGPCRREAIVVERPLLSQAFSMICKRGAQGTSQSELATCVGTPKLEARSLCRNLQRHAVVKCIMEDEGRQRVTKYVAKEFEAQSELSQKFEEERRKILELTDRYNVANAPLINDGGGSRNGLKAIEPARSSPAPKPKTPGRKDEKEKKAMESSTLKKRKRKKKQRSDDEVDGHEDEECVGVGEGRPVPTTLGVPNDKRLRQRANYIEQRKAYHHQRRDNPHVTYRLLKRANLIIAAVRDHQIIDNVFHLQKMIIDEEEKEGYSNKIDKKTMLRLIDRLAKDGHVKSIKTVLKHGSASKNLHFICEPNLGAGDSVVASAIEQAKVKYFSMPTARANSSSSSSSSSTTTPASATTPSSAKAVLKTSPPSSPSFGLDWRDKAVSQKRAVVDLVESVERRKRRGSDNAVGNASPPKRIKMADLSGQEDLRSEDEAGDEDSAEGAWRNGEAESMALVPAKTKSLDREGAEDDAAIDSGEEDFEEENEGGGGGEERKKKVLEYSPGIARKYGIMPKMMRLQVVFEYLWYLTYGYDGNSALSSVDSRPTAGKRRRPPKRYRNQADWRMYVPPLPRHSGYAPGWVLISDALLSMPLSIFCQIITISYKVDRLSDYLAHPTKRHLLLRHLPLTMRWQLLHGRKYIYNFHELCTRLCYMGLMSFGPHQFKEKDQVFVFVHRRSMVVDTTISDPHYNLVSADKDYSSEIYEFDNQRSVEKFWFDLQCVCLNTPLGVGRGLRGATDGNEWPILETLDVKRVLKDCLRPLDPSTFNPVVDEAATPILPGDGLGAGGLDSSFYGHMKRNWTWLSLDGGEKRKTDKVEKAEKSEQPKKLEAIEDGNDSTNDGVSSGGSRNGRALVSDANGKPFTLTSAKRRAKLKFDGDAVAEAVTEGIDGPAKDASAPIDDDLPCKTFVIDNATEFKAARKGGKGLKKNSTVASVPTIKSRRIRHKREKTPYYDDEDLAALKRMTKERVDWSTPEDSLLLLCRVASSFMDDRKQMIVPWSCVRDVLHEHVPLSKDKTSKACQRRLNYVLKNAQTALNVAVFLGEAMQDSDLVNSFRNRKYKISDQDDVISNFVSCLEAMRLKFMNNSLLQETAISVGNEQTELPGDKDQLLADYHIKVSSGKLYEKSRHADVDSLADVYFGVLHNLVHSTLSLDDKAGRSYELFKVFSQYPEQMLQSVLNAMRRDQIISKMKAPSPATASVGSGKRRRHSLSLPFTALNYHFSQRYIYTFLSRYPVDIFYQAYNLLLQMRTTPGDDRGSPTAWDTGGSCALAVTLMALGKIDFELEIPDQIIVIDTKTMNMDIVRRGKLLKPMMMGRKTASDDEDEELLEKHLGREIEGAEGIGFGGSSRRVSTSDGESPRRRLTKVRFANDVTEYAAFPPENHLSREVPARQASRINLAIARNMSFRDINVREMNPQDNVVVNACTVRITPNRATFDLEDLRSCEVLNCRLQQKKKSKEGKSGPPVLTSAPLSHSRDEIFLKHTVRNYVLQAQLSTIPSLVCGIDVFRSRSFHEGAKETEVALSLGVADFLKQKEHLGATWGEILARFSQSPATETRAALYRLAKSDLVLQAGITEPRFVHHDFRRPWIIHSYKNLKGRGTWIDPFEKEAEDREAAQSELAGEGDNEERQPYNVVAIPGRRGQEPELGRRSARNRGKDVAIQTASSSTNGSFVRVQLIPRPWRKPDGTLNRPVLHMMLRSVLMFVMSYPGSSLDAVADKFSPTVQPIAVRELLSVLHKVGAVTRVFLRRTHAPSLFSASPATVAAEPEDTTGDAEMIYEPAVDCVLKMGQIFPELGETSLGKATDALNMFAERSTKNLEAI